MLDNQPNCPPDRPATDDSVIIERLRKVLNGALKGKPEVIEMALAALLAGGHILFDDLPGIGKTTLGKAVASAVGGTFGRLQGTPDLLPSDITGFNIFNRKTQEFEFRRGPIFSDVLLADEINRATPRTQSALFEAMSERQVSVDGQTFPLVENFFVIATQNPIEHHGTFELPEAQLDRFAVKLTIGYPDARHEAALLRDEAHSNSKNRGEPERVITPEQLVEMRDRVADVQVAEKIQDYFVDLATFIRNHRDVRNGLSPRALIIWQRMAQSWALINGRDFVTPDDVQKTARPVLGVRLSGNFKDVTSFIDETISAVDVPVE